MHNSHYDSYMNIIVGYVCIQNSVLDRVVKALCGVQIQIQLAFESVVLQYVCNLCARRLKALLHV